MPIENRLKTWCGITNPARHKTRRKGSVEGEAGRGGGDGEGDGGGLDDGDVVVDVADGGVEGDGVAVGGNHVGYHLLHGVVAVVGAVAGELAHDEAGKTRQHAAEAQLIHDALYLVDGFFDVLDEEDGAGTDYVVGRVDEFGYHGQIAAQQSARGCAGAVERVGIPGVDGLIAAQDGHLRGVVLVVGAEGKVLAHVAVHAGDIARGQQGVERGDVGEADKPLGVVAQRQLGEAVEQMHGAVAAAGAQHGAHGGVGEGGAQVGQAAGVACGVLSHLAEGVGHDVDSIAHGAERVGGFIDEGRVDGAGGRNDGNLVAVAQRARHGGGFVEIHCVNT